MTHFCVNSAGATCLPSSACLSHSGLCSVLRGLGCLLRTEPQGPGFLAAAPSRRSPARPLESCFPHFTGHELKAEIGTLPKPEAEMAFKAGQPGLGACALIGMLSCLPKTGAEWAVDLAHAGSMEPLRTSHPDPTFSGTVLATLTDTSSGAYTPQTSANTTN